MYLNPLDTSPVSTSIGTDGILDLPLTCLIRRTLKKGMTFVDIGANLGYFAFLASRMVGDDGIVFAFEPETINYEFLSKSVQANGYRNIRPFRKAISDTDGTVTLFRAAPGQQNASVVTDRGHGKEEVKSMTLDEFWMAQGKPRIDFIKIHIGGDDSVALKGASQILRTLRPTIAMVFEPEKWGSKNPLLGFLSENYQTNEIIESPRLLRSVDLFSLATGNPIPVYLVPRGENG
jgi:FkbM family methyltransferase